MAATIDARGTANSGTGVSTLTNTGLTIGAGLTNSALVATLAFRIKAVSSVSVTWNGVALTKIIELPAAAALGNIQLWGLINPAAGNQNLVASWTTSSDMFLCGESWSNVDQTGGVTSFPNSTPATGTGATGSVTVTSATGNACVAVHANTSDEACTALSNNTIYRNQSTFPEGGANDAAGAATVTLTATYTNTPAWLAIGTDIKAAGAGAGSPLRRNSSLDGLGASGPFFSNPLARRMLGWRKGLLIPVFA